ncbi:hypothetical protein [Secundilactobacillus silagei]|mgnify:CR=1 FL=1|uniref:Uncharacterized protein n=1 Tax=Secundilactobacillus silagei JCM 19001 TaxID=1302250 RepID=A0A1Z5IGX9_9LACO|nr:hypothetical protein [Secundilactobacillus silagei]TDG73431.1 hypothetical protein C5L25_000580 [Secundilactobacillus silagei JCM 19001]GAX00802.1 hypothetical protein IWT126_00817 [Secundilactobacillus silagei JCM 19001]
MPLLAIIVDVITALTYFFQAKLGTVPVYSLGIVVQAVATLVLIIWTFTYQHKRYRNPLIFGFFTATFSYGIIVISAAVNALILILYVMNITGINSVIFG